MEWHNSGFPFHCPHSIAPIPLTNFRTRNDKVTKQSVPGAAEIIKGVLG